MIYGWYDTEYVSYLCVKFYILHHEHEQPCHITSITQKLV